MARLGLAILLVFCFAAPAAAWTSPGRLPLCDAPEVIAKIQTKFAYANRKTFHWGVAIESVTSIYERPEQIRTDSLIARRFCQGTALLTDGSNSEVVYLIEAKQGFASIGYRVESCLPRFDPWHVYDGWCRSIRP